MKSFYSLKISMCGVPLNSETTDTDADMDADPDMLILM